MSHIYDEVEIRKAIRTFNTTRSLEKAAESVGANKNTVQRWINCYRRYGESWFTDYPEPLK
jgi:transposase